MGRTDGHGEAGPGPLLLAPGHLLSRQLPQKGKYREKVYVERNGQWKGKR